MQSETTEGGIFFRPEDDFDPAKIFECGQCFRWNPDRSGTYTGVAMGRAVRLQACEGGYIISCTEKDFADIWFDYFDFGRHYADMRARLSTDAYMRAACEHGAGIRLLNQDKWETLCSFILSQCNNIGRIKKIVEALCRAHGDPIAFEGGVRYTFPSAEKLASLQAEDLVPLRAGYRVPYILSAARSVAEGRLDLDALSGLSFDAALHALKAERGIGDKVANCVILFSLRIPEAFPIDVHMKRAVEAHYGKLFDPSVFGELAGLAQQYMFHYQRTGKDPYT